MSNSREMDSSEELSESEGRLFILPLLTIIGLSGVPASRPGQFLVEYYTISKDTDS
jgi:hypothetical protein